jgi:hypothetical protein
MSAKGNVTLQRKPFFIPGYTGPCDILVDGTKIGDIAAGKAHRFEVDPGHHKLQIKSWGVASSEFVIEISPNQSINLECGIVRPFKWLSIAMLVSFIANVVRINFFGKITTYNMAIDLICWPIIILWVACNFKPGAIYYLKEVSS